MRSLRIAFRTLLRRPAFTLMAVLTLALGLGATSALFTVVNGVLLEPLPYEDPDELVRIVHPVPRLHADWRWGVSEGGWFALRDANRSFEDIGVYELPTFGLSAGEAAERVQAARVSASLLKVLRARPAVGRLFRAEDQAMQAPLRTVLGHALWRTRFGGDPAVVGSTVRIEGRPAEVVGVMEAGVQLPDARVDLWVPASVSRDNPPVNWHRFRAVGRLRDGATVASATADLRGIVGRFNELMPEAYHDEFMASSGFTADVVPLREHVVGGVAGTLWILLAAVGLVLVIGCANVANLFLVRLETSRRERAVRAALGGSWYHVARSSLAESSIIAGAAALLGLLLAWWGIELLQRLGAELPRMDQVAMGRDSLLFTAAAAAVLALLFGLLPARRGRRIRLEALREGVGITRAGRRSLRAGLVVGQLAMALVVLAAAGLMLRSFEKLRSVDPGLDPEGVLTVQVMLPRSSYGGFESVASFYRRLVERVEALPEVAAAGATQQLPLAGSAGCSGIHVDDADAETSGCFASTIQVTPGYFEAMGITVDGYVPGWDDVAAGRGQVVVSRPLAEHVWPGRDPLGRGIRGHSQRPPYYRVSGVAAPVRNDGLDRAPVERVYFPMLPLEGAPLWSPPRQMTLVVRSAGPSPEALVTPVRLILAGLDPTAATGAIRPMTEVVARSTARTRFVMLLLSVAAAMAMTLGVIGLYAVVAYAVAQRRAEIGIRMALGARAAAVRRLVVARAARLAGAGLLLGLGLSLAATRVLASHLFEVTPLDPSTLVAAVLVLGGVALAAAYVPAVRASRVEPMRVLRDR